MASCRLEGGRGKAYHMRRKLRVSISAENSRNFYIYIHSQEMISVYIIRHSMMAGNPGFRGEGGGGGNAKVRLRYDMWTKLILP
jgi:hypothetical protein